MDDAPPRPGPLHKLLERQVKRLAPQDGTTPDAWRPLLEAISEVYAANDADRGLLERSLELTSQDLLQRNAELRKTGARTERELEGFFVGSLDLLAVADFQGHFLRLNPAWTETLGWSQQDLLNRPFIDFVHPEDVEATQQATAGLANAKDAVGFENRYRHKDGSYRTLVWNSRADVPAGRIYAVARDVTEQRLASERLATAARAAQAAAEAKSQFLANMSHEIRTPMNAILGLGRLLRDTQLDAHQRELAEGVRVSGEHLVTILNDILDFSKLESGRVELVAEPVDIVPLARECLRLVEPEAARKGLDLRFEVRGAGPPILRVDGGRVRQVLLNLLSNALKFTTHGSVTVRLAGEVGGDERARVRIDIIDTGIGIPKERYDRLFQSFSQVDASTTRTFGGTGLGLAISKRLVERMGGTIGFTSEVAKGSNFFFTIVGPQAVGSEAKAAPADPAKTPPRPLAILLVEDNALNQMVATRMLDRLGYKADVVGNGAEAVDAVQHRRYDIVLMDIHMPVMDGVEATREIHSRMGENSPWIVAMTADAMPGDREKFLAAGADGYLAKPVRLEDLADVLGNSPAVTTR